MPVYRYDGNVKLLEQEITINFEQQRGPYFLTAYSKDPPANAPAGDPHDNYATFIDAPLGQHIPNCTLVDAADKPRIQEMDQQAAAGKIKRLFTSVVFVSGQPRQIVAYR